MRIKVINHWSNCLITNSFEVNEFLISLCLERLVLWRLEERIFIVKSTAIIRSRRSIEFGNIERIPVGVILINHNFGCPQVTVTPLLWQLFQISTSPSKLVQLFERNWYSSVNITEAKSDLTLMRNIFNYMKCNYGNWKYTHQHSTQLECRAFKEFHFLFERLKSQLYKRTLFNGC